MNVLYTLNIHAQLLSDILMDSSSVDCEESIEVKVVKREAVFFFQISTRTRLYLSEKSFREERNTVFASIRERLCETVEAGTALTCEEVPNQLQQMCERP